VNYYPFHIGDYASHTRGLTIFEDLAYRRLLDEYYLHERALNECSTSVARQIGMREHQDAVDFVLKSFFELTTDGWINRRADQEISKFHSKQDAASKAGRASAERRLNGGSTSVERSSTNQNQEPEPEPSSSSKKNRARPVEKPIEVSDGVWLSFLQVRKAKKAAVTDLAILGIKRECVKAGISLEDALTICCERGWASFKAEWMTDKRKSSAGGESFYERDQRLKRQEAAKWGGAGSSGDFMTIDEEAQNVPAIESH